MVDFSCVVFRFYYNISYPLGFYGYPDSVDLNGVPWVQVYVLDVEIEVGINEVCAS